MFLSFIVPVYNAEQYLGECLDSLLHQDIFEDDYEIICINDGSTDDSLKILHAYQTQYTNIIVIDKENGGVSAARNAGLDTARGEYVWMVDADDFIQKNCLGNIKMTAGETKSDRLEVQCYTFRDRLTPQEQQKYAERSLQSNTYVYNIDSCASILKRKFLNKHGLRYCEIYCTHKYGHCQNLHSRYLDIFKIDVPLF